MGGGLYSAGGWDDMAVLCAKAIKIIEKDYMDETLTLQSVSDRLHISANYLGANIKKHTGDTFTEIAATATMVYFVARMIGCFTGGIVLSKISNRVGILVCGTIMTASTVCFAIFCSITSNPPVALFWVAVALVGFGNSNVFSLFLSHALMYRPERQNEISGLMLMGLIGGAIFPPIMGALADAMSAQLGAIIVMSVGCIYVLVIGVGYKAIIEGKKAAVKA